MYNINIAGFNLLNIFFYFIFYSFLGWLMETIWVFITTKKIVNRGFLCGPICPIYGFGMLLLILFLSNFKDNVAIYFWAGLVFATTIEYFTGFILEKLFHAKWWDYSYKKTNLNGRIALDISIIWGVLSVLVMKFLQPHVNNLMTYFPVSEIVLFIESFIFLFIVDIIVTILSMMGFKNKLKELAKIKEELHILIETNKLLESADLIKMKLYEYTESIFVAFEKIKLNEEISQKMEQLKQRYFDSSNLSNKVHKRILLAFPNFKSTHHPSILKELRNKVLKK